MKQEDVMAMLQEMGLTEGDTWTRSDLLAHLDRASGVQVDEIREPSAPDGLLTIKLRRTDGEGFALSFEPRGNDRYSLSTGEPSI